MGHLSLGELRLEPQQQSGRSFQLVSSMLDLGQAFNVGGITTYNQVVQFSQQ